MKHFNANRREESGVDFPLRKKLVQGLILFGMIALVYRATDIQVVNNDFLKNQGNIRHISDMPISAYRGKIVDRNAEPLAISTPVQSVWINPQQLKGADAEKIRQMEKILTLPRGKVSRLLKNDSNKRFAYLKRRVNPSIAEKIKDLKLSGVYLQREFKRFYPAGQVSAHLIGFTSVDDIGQEGLERTYEQLLKGTPGSKRVIKDGKRRVIEDVEEIKESIPGQDLQLSIDQRIQYIAYRELQEAMIEHQAQSAAIVVLDAKSGEVLAAASQPSFNPNTRKNLHGRLYRNRALTDVFEPGSTVKPFVVAAALDGKFIDPNIEIETHGFYRVGRELVKDVHNYGTLDLMHVLKKSSNVAVSKIALKMPPEYFWGIYNKLGFGVSAGVGFPGEASGSVLDYPKWHDFEQATLSFGYGLNVSTLQLARAYTALADDGLLHSVSLLKRDEDLDARQVFSAKTARSVRAMLEHVVKKDGTAYQARVDGYRVAGKTGTVKKNSVGGGYTKKEYFAVFVGLAPASNPKFVIAVMVDTPSAGKYYGGLVAAPVFSKVMAGTLRVYGIAPDQEDTMPVLLEKKSTDDV